MGHPRRVRPTLSRRKAHSLPRATARTSATERAAAARSAPATRSTAATAWRRAPAASSAITVVRPPAAAAPRPVSSIPKDFACQRALGKQGRTLAAKAATLRQACLDRVAAGKLACQANQCVLNPSSTTPVTVGGSCSTAADCCPNLDAADPTKTTSAKLAAAEATAAKAVRSACSLAVGPDKKKGTDDDVYVDPQVLGYGGACLAIFGECGTIGTSASITGGSDGLIACMQCTAEAASRATLEWTYPLAGSGTLAQSCERALGQQAGKLNTTRLKLQQQCLDRTVQNKLGCLAGQYFVDPGKSTAAQVSGSSCTVAADCCPSFDAVDPARTTATKLTRQEAVMAAAIKVKCSASAGPDGNKGTNDDTYLDPSTLGFGAMCLSTFRQCRSMPASPLAATGTGSDLVDCLTCIMNNAADTLVDFHLHRAP